MKKFTSLLLAVLMVASLFSTFVVFTSAAGNELLKTYDAAAEGELLYEAKFGQKEGCYQSKVFAIGKIGDDTDANTFSTKVSEDGKEIQITYLPAQGDLGSRRLYYGGKVDGLKVGGGQKYTIVYNVHTPDVDKTINYGVYYNFPTTFATDDLVLREEYTHMLGYYGTPANRQTLCLGGDKYSGKYRSSDNYYVGQYAGYYDELKYPTNAEGYNEIAIEVEDNAFRVYIDNIFFDEGYVYDGTNVVCENLGISFYLYNNQTYDGDTFTAKNVKVYKGHLKKNTATMPDYAKVDAPTTSTNVLLKEYAAAADGDLLYTVKMNATDGVYVPKVWQDGKPTKKVTPPGQTTVIATDTSVEFINAGADSHYWWGNVIEGLKVNKDTKYTMSLKVQNKIKKNGGFGFVTTRSETINKCFNFYGCFNEIEGLENQPSVVIQKGTGKIPGLQMNTKDYTSIYPVQDEEGYIDVKVEIDGLLFSVYYKSTVYGLYDVEPYWALFEQYDMSEDLVFTGGEAELCFMTYTHNLTTNWIAKDVNIYKGLTVDKTTPEVTEEDETTDAPTDAPTTTAKPQETTKAPAATTKAPTTTEAPKTQKGCGGMVAGGLAIVAIASLGAVVVSKKKEN